jgi:lipopolysaccharide export system permease protein
MKTLKTLIYAEVYRAVTFASLGFLALFSFFDLVDDLGSIGRVAIGQPGVTYGLEHALLYVGFGVPWRLYQLLPICVLIGTVFVLSRLAQSSEFTILRVSGLGPWLALRVMLVMGLVFVAITFVAGDYLAPLGGKQQILLKAKFDGSVSAGRTGAWLKETRANGNASVNVGAMNAQSGLERISIFEFSKTGQLLQTITSATATIGDNNTWALNKGEVRYYDQATPGPSDEAVLNPRGTTARPQLHISSEPFKTMQWPTEITADMVSVAVLDPSSMRTLDLFQFINHLQANQQSAQRYEIEFWRKLFYPLSCLVMVVLALPFAYLHFRSGGVAGYVFIGFLAGISFFLLNNVFGYIGNLNEWRPWVAAATPSLMYSVVSLGAFSWLVLRR